RPRPPRRNKDQLPSGYSWLEQRQLLSLPIDIQGQSWVRGGLRIVPKQLSGDHTWMATPVPIPNTAVKHPGPMVVPAGARVGYRRDFFRKARGLRSSGFFHAPYLSLAILIISCW